MMSSQPQDPLDHFGFRSNPGEPIKLDEAPIDTKILKKENARMEKWRKILPNLKTLVAKKDSQLKKRIRKGIPDCFRARVWPIISKAALTKNTSPIPYRLLVDSEHAPALDDIILDVARTFPTHKLFAETSGIGQQSLRNVLKAISITHAKMGYCQGLNFVAALFLIYCNDEDAYWTLKSYLKNYQMEDYYTDLNTVQKPLYVADRLVDKFFSKVGKLLAENDVRAVIYAPGWILTTFATALPFNVIVRIMDCFLYENFKIFYRATLAIIKYKEKELLQCNRIDQLLMCLKDFSDPKWKDEDAFMKTVFSFNLSRKDVKRIEATYQPPKQRPKYNPQN